MRSTSDPKLPALLSLICSGLSAILQCFAYALSYEAPQSNYFSPTSIFPILSVLLALMAACLGAAAAFQTDRRALPTSALPCRLAAFPAALGYLAGGIALLLSNSTSLVTATAICLLISTVYHLATLFGSTKHSALTVLIGFAPIAAGVLLSGVYYFDNTLEMNAPLKVSVMMGLLCTTVYYTGELRILLERAMPRLFVFLSTLTVGIGSLSALPVPVAFLMGHFNRATTASSLPLLASKLEYPMYLAGALVLLGATVGAALRLCSLLSNHHSAEDSQ